MRDLLRAVLADKRGEAAFLADDAVPRREAARRDFAAALSAPGLAAIAEIKRRSPSAGDLRAAALPERLAPALAGGGAAALSVLTDAPRFGGSLVDLARARAACDLPVLRKDFVVDARQVDQTAVAGADAVLLIVRLLDDGLLRRLLERADAWGLDALVETHDAGEIDRAIAAGARIVGINSRDLDTFTVDLERALRLRERIPPGVIAVAESGIRDRDDVARVAAAGFDAMLVGEALMRADEPEAALAALLVETAR